MTFAALLCRTTYVHVRKRVVIVLYVVICIVCSYRNVENMDFDYLYFVNEDSH